MNLLHMLSQPVWRSRPTSALKRDMLISLLSLAWVVEARDPYTGGHLWRVSQYANLLASRAGLTPLQTAQVTIGGFLHDLGKVSVPDAILRKADKLDDHEYAIIKTHPDVGKNVLLRHPLGELVVDAVYSHHERPDGNGYPRGIQSRDIPEMAKIVGICDAFDAMTSARPYRPPMSADRALGIIKANLGTQFDSRFGEIFLALGHTPEMHHIIGHSDEGIPLRHCASCGPTIVVRRRAIERSKAFCPACGGGYVLKGGNLDAVSAGVVGAAADLEPIPDNDLIERIATKNAAFF